MVWTKERQQAYYREWYQRNKDKARTGMRRNKLRTKYGLTPEDVEHMKAAQLYRCAICAHEDPGRWCVDHCHETGKVRALLCNGCNALLGHAKEDRLTLQSAVRYLDLHKPTVLDKPEIRDTVRPE